VGDAVGYAVLAAVLLVALYVLAYQQHRLRKAEFEEVERVVERLRKLMEGGEGG